MELIESRHFDAVVSDYQMPRMDGIELLKLLRSKRINVPFVLFTGWGREDVAIAALNNGADYNIQKGGEPVAQFAELRNAIMHSIHRKSAEELAQGIVDNAPLMIMIVDEDRRIQTFNRAVLEFTGMTAREVHRPALRTGVQLRQRQAERAGLRIQLRMRRLQAVGSGKEDHRNGREVPAGEGGHTDPGREGRRQNDPDGLHRSDPHVRQGPGPGLPEGPHRVQEGREGRDRLTILSSVQKGMSGPNRRMDFLIIVEIEL
jgi:PAS domain S-box-containing protein